MLKQWAKKYEQMKMFISSLMWIVREMAVGVAVLLTAHGEPADSGAGNASCLRRSVFVSRRNKCAAL
jgi:hypothetical protein